MKHGWMFWIFLALTAAVFQPAFYMSTAIENKSTAGILRQKKLESPNMVESGRVSATLTVTTREESRLDLPVINGTPLPQLKTEIDIENAASLKEIARYGNGVLSGMAWSGRDDSLLLLTSTGFELCSKETLTLWQAIDTQRWDTFLALSQDGEQVASGGASVDSSIHITSLTGGYSVQQLTAVGKNLYSAQYSPDDSILATAAGDGSIVLWDINTSQIIHILSGHKAAVKSMAFSPDGSFLASASFDHSIRLWNLPEGSLAAELQGHEQEVSGVVFTPDGRYLLSGGYDKVIFRWNLEEMKFDRLIGGHGGYITSLSISPDGSLIAASSADHRIKIWDVEGDRELAILTGHRFDVLQVLFSPDGEFLASRSIDGELMLWNVAECLSEKYCMPDEQLEKYSSRWLRVSYSSEASMAGIVMEGDIVEIWDMNSRTRKLRLGYPTIDVREILFSPDGQTLYLGTNEGFLSVWNTTDGRKIANLKAYTGDLRSASISPDGKLLVSGGLWGKSGYTILDLGSGKIIIEASDDIGAITTTTFSQDNKLIAAGGEGGSVFIIDAQSFEVVNSFEFAGRITRLSFSPDGYSLAVVLDDHEVELINRVSGRKQATLSSIPKTIEELAFSQDGTILALGTWEGSILLWDVKHEKKLAELNGHTATVKLLKFVDEFSLLSISQDGTMRYWGTVP